jgi:fructose-1,6-bisphosphatase
VAFANKFNQGFHVLFWEDDNVACILKLDSNTLVEVLKSTANAFGTVAIKALPGASPVVVAAVFVGTLFSNAGAWLLTNDDFLGAAVDQASAGYSYPGNTHVIMDGTTLNGRATIVYRQ